MGLLNRAGEIIGISRPAAPEVRAMPDGVRPPSRTAATPEVNLDRALTLPAVYRSIQILSTAVSQLSIRVERGGVPMDSPPALVAQPDVDQTLSQFLKRTMIGLAGTGNAYWLIFKRNGVVTGLEVMNPVEVSISRHVKTGAKIYNYRGKEYTAAQVKHLRLLEVPGHDEGVGPIQACRQGVAGALALRDYADNWFGQGGVPTGVLTTPSQLDPEEADAYRARWHELQASRDVAVLGQGLTYAPIILKPGDAQFLESQEFAITDVARMFGIPATYLLAEVNGSTLVYTNSRDVDYQFAKYTLMTYLVEIEDALSSVLVRGQVAKFDLDDFLRPDAKTQAEINAAYLAMNVITPAEIRSDIGRAGPPPKPAPAPPAPPQDPAAPADIPNPEGDTQ